MKKTFFVFLTLFMIMMTFVSCNSNAVSSEDGRGVVSFEELAKKTLSAKVTHLEKTDLYWRYCAIKADQGEDFGATSAYGTTASVDTSKPVTGGDNWSAGLAGTHEFSAGSWNFTLYAFRENEKGAYAATNYVYNGTKGGVQVAATSTTVQKVSVSVNPVTETGLTGVIVLNNITKPTTEGYLKYQLDGTTGTWSNFTTTGSAYSATIDPVAPGAHTVYVGLFDDIDTNPKKIESVALTVYRGLTTTVTGSSDLNFGTVQFDADMPTTTAVGTVSATALESRSPAVTPVVSASPKEGGTTTVEFKPGALDASGIAAGVSYDVSLKVSAGEATGEGGSSYVIGDGNVAIAGIDLEVSKIVNGTAAEVVSSFDSAVTVTTFIGAGREDEGPFEAKYLVYDQSGNVTNIETYACEYDNETGYISFETYHFSTYYITTQAQALIVNTNKSYKTLALTERISSRISHGLPKSFLNSSSDLKYR